VRGTTRVKGPNWTLNVSARGECQRNSASASAPTSASSLSPSG
jgi:hypothetical protein